MKFRRTLFAVLLILFLTLSMVGPVSANHTDEANEYIQQIMNYYRYHQDAAATDIDCLLYALSQHNPYKEQDWISIMEYWSYVNRDMTIYPDVLPDGLPQDNTLCIVVMGYALNSDGTMRKELIGRLETALASAKKYPNAYIVCTGGGTAQNNKSRTEAGEMSKWLIEKGIDKKRIIVEDQSLSTVANAINTCQILANEYPLVTHLAIVTSDYHLARSCLLFHAQATLSASKGAPLLCVAANAGYRTNRAAESIDTQANNLSQLVGIPINGMPKPQLSKLDRIKVWDDVEYTPGPELDFQVMAYYDTGLYRDVSKYVEYAGIDFTVGGPQEALVLYQEGDIVAFSTLRIEIPFPETEAPTEPPATTDPEPETVPQTDVTEPVPMADESLRKGWVLPVIIPIGLFAVALLTKKLAAVREQRKAAKLAREEERIDLPDDDSPLEYI